MGQRLRTHTAHTITHRAAAGPGAAPGARGTASDDTHRSHHHTELQQALAQHLGLVGQRLRTHTAHTITHRAAAGPGAAPGARGTASEDTHRSHHHTQSCSRPWRSTWGSWDRTHTTHTITHRAAAGPGVAPGARGTGHTPLTPSHTELQQALAQHLGLVGQRLRTHTTHTITQSCSRPWRSTWGSCDRTHTAHTITHRAAAGPGAAPGARGTGHTPLTPSHTELQQALAQHLGLVGQHLTTHTAHTITHRAAAGPGAAPGAHGTGHTPHTITQSCSRPWRSTWGSWDSV